MRVKLRAVLFDDDDCLLVKERRRKIDERRDEAISDGLASWSGGASRYG